MDISPSQEPTNCRCTTLPSTLPPPFPTPPTPAHTDAHTHTHAHACTRADLSEMDGERHGGAARQLPQPLLRCLPGKLGRHLGQQLGCGAVHGILAGEPAGGGPPPRLRVEDELHSLLNLRKVGWGGGVVGWEGEGGGGLVVLQSAKGKAAASAAIPPSLHTRGRQGP
jgi:hypothetical protein